MYRYIIGLIIFSSLVFAGEFMDKLNVDNIQIDGNTISSTDSNGNVIIAPNGTGALVAPNGTESLPGLVLDGTDVDNGLYYIGANNWGMSVAGNKAIDMVASTTPTGGYSNVGLCGGTASTTDDFAIVCQRDFADQLWFLMTNNTSNAAARTGFRVDLDDHTGNFGGNSNNNGNVSLGSRLFMWQDVGGDGLSLISQAAGSEIGFWVDGLTDSEERMRIESTGVAIETSGNMADPNAAVMLDFGASETSKAAIRLNPLTTTERNAVSTPPEGSVTYNETDKTVDFYNGTAWQTLTPSSAASNSSDLQNMGLASSVASNALTVAIKQSDGSTDPSAGSPVKISFRDSTASDGSFNLRTLSSALSLVVPSGATLGHGDGNEGNVYVYAIDNSGTVEIGVSSTVLEEDDLQTTVSISTSADDSDFYSDAVYSNVPIRLLGRFKSTQTTAGTWATAMSSADLAPYIDQDPEYERIEAVLSADVTSSDDGVPADITGLSIDLSTGTWIIGYSGSASVQKLSNDGQIYGTFFITDSSNTLVSESASIFGHNQATTSETLISQLSNSAEVTVTDATTYKMRFEWSDNGSSGGGQIRARAAEGAALGLSQDHESFKFWAERKK